MGFKRGGPISFRWVKSLVCPWIANFSNLTWPCWKSFQEISLPKFPSKNLLKLLAWQKMSLFASWQQRTKWALASADLIVAEKLQNMTLRAAFWNGIGRCHSWMFGTDLGQSWWNFTNLSTLTLEDSIPCIEKVNDLEFYIRFKEIPFSYSQLCIKFIVFIVILYENYNFHSEFRV